MPPALLATIGNLITGALILAATVAAAYAGGYVILKACELHNRRVDVVRRNTPQPRHKLGNSLRPVTPPQTADLVQLQASDGTVLGRLTVNGTAR